MKPVVGYVLVVLGAWGLVALILVAEVGRALIPDPTDPVTFTFSCPRLGAPLGLTGSPIVGVHSPVTLTQRDRALNEHDVLGPCIAQDPGAMETVVRARAHGGR